MGQLQRLDKILSDAGVDTRSRIREIIRAGRVTVDGAPVLRPEEKFDPEICRIFADGRPIRDKFCYLMMNKPKGYVCAVKDPREETVLELLPESYRRLGLFPVGRLDKDTEGLLFLTNDGEWGHNITAPRRHVEKTYYVEAEKELKEGDKAAFLAGIRLKDGMLCQPARLEIEGKTACRVAICEGKYHQVKRMFAAMGNRVLRLERIAVGGLLLDPRLKRGDFRELTPDEVSALSG